MSVTITTGNVTVNFDLNDDGKRILEYLMNRWWDNYRLHVKGQMKTLAKRIEIKTWDEFDETTYQLYKSGVNSLKSDCDEIMRIAHSINWNPSDKNLIDFKNNSDVLLNILKNVEKRASHCLLDHYNDKFNECTDGIGRLINKCKLGKWDQNEYRISKQRLDNVQEDFNKIMKLVGNHDDDFLNVILPKMKTYIDKSYKILRDLKEHHESVGRKKSWNEYLFGIKYRK
jgi:hypothetical protein